MNTKGSQGLRKISCMLLSQILPGQNTCTITFISFYGWESPMHCCFHLCTYARPNSVLCPSHVFFLVLYLLAPLTCCCWQRKSCKHVYTQFSAHPESLRRGRVSSENIWGEQKLDGANSRGWGLGGSRAVYDKRSIVAVFHTSILCGRWTWMLFSVLTYWVSKLSENSPNIEGKLQRILSSFPLLFFYGQGLLSVEFEIL